MCKRNTWTVSSQQLCSTVRRRSNLFHPNIKKTSINVLLFHLMLTWLSLRKPIIKGENNDTAWRRDRRRRNDDTKHDGGINHDKNSTTIWWFFFFIEFVFWLVWWNLLINIHCWKIKLWLSDFHYNAFGWLEKRLNLKKKNQFHCWKNKSDRDKPW